MKKLVMIFPFLAFVCSAALAQKNDLWIRNSDKGPYLEHKVVPKESFYSVGRLYNVHPRALAAFNKLDMNKGLLIDQKLRIPLTDTNFNQTGNSGTPVYYKTGNGESINEVSKACNKVKLVKLREWNDLDNDNPPAGKKLIIGFLKSNEMPSVTIKVKPRTDEPVTKTNTDKTGNSNTTEEKKEHKKDEPKDEKKDSDKEVVKEERPQDKPEIKEEKKTDPVITKKEVKPVLTEQGYFKPFYDEQVKDKPPVNDETVTSGIFKTASGWQDAKYYLLMDEVQPGTIVKVINPSNNKAVYAKVLGQMAGIRQNEGLNIRISNAAASALDISEEEKFIVKVNY